MFTDRIDAGRKLAQELTRYRGEDILVLAIPRGGVQIGFEIARELDAELSLIIAKKLPCPCHPESGFGAIAEDGPPIIRKEASRGIHPKTIQAIIHQQEQEIKRRIQILRGNQPLPSISGRTVILVDEGIAMGSTMQTAIKIIKKHEPEKLIVAAPVGSPESVHALEGMQDVDEVYVLEKPQFFKSIKQAYRHWHTVPDHEVLTLISA